MENDDDVNAKVPELRLKFRETFSENIQSGAYHERDLERLDTEDGICRRFLIHQKQNVEKAANMVDSSFRWRKELGVNDLTEKSFPRDFHELGGCYFHNVDKDGHKILYFQVSKHKKDPDRLFQAKQYIAWWIDREWQKAPEDTIVVFFDMQGAGISNMDLDLVRFQISCFATYYPAYLAYMLIYEMPWVLNAIWKLIKQLLTEEQQKFIHFTKKADITQYIDKDQLWLHMGGTDPYVYQYLPSEDSGIDMTAETNGTSPSESFETKVGDGESALRKRVTFATDKENHQYNSFDEKTHHSKKKKGSKSGPSEILTKAAPVFNGSLLTISPMEQLLFLIENGEDETLVLLTITNVADTPVAYKVKTTTPDNYRVRTSTGILEPKQVADIYVYLQPGCGDEVVKRDKFLVMAMKVDDKNIKSSALAQQWKTVNRSSLDYMEHRLWCAAKVVGLEEKTDDQLLHSKLDTIEGQMIQMLDRQRDLEGSLQTSNKMLVILAGFLFVITLLLCLEFFTDILSDPRPLIEACKKLMK